MTPNGPVSFGVLLLTPLDKRADTVLATLAMHEKRGCVQITLPDHLREAPYAWANRMQWFAATPSLGDEKERRPHISMVFAAITARLAAMPAKERDKFLRDGAKIVLDDEKRLGVPGRQRVRLMPVDGVVTLARRKPTARG